MSTATITPRRTAARPAGMVAVMKYFGMPIATFKAEWGQLTDTAKSQLRVGVENGSLTY